MKIRENKIIVVQHLSKNDIIVMSFLYFFTFFSFRDSVKFKNKLRTIEPHFLKKN